MRFNKNSNLLIILTLVILNVIIYFNSIGNEFVWDDVIVQKNQRIRDAGNLKEILMMEDAVPNFSGTSFFRPLVSVTYLIDYQIHGGKAYGFRLTNITFHILCSIMLFYLVVLITKNRLLSFVAALIFSAQAVHVEAVTFIVGRNNVLCTLFILLSLYYYVKNARQAKKTHIVYSMLFLFLGAASKEFAFVVPFIFILYDISYDDDYSAKKNFSKYIAAFSTVFLFLIYKSSVMTLNRSFTLNTPTLYKRVITTFPIMIKYIVSQIVPYNLSIYINMPMKESFLEFPVFGSFILLAALVIMTFWYRAKERCLFFSFFAYLILLVPISNIIKIPGTLMADRWLYPASAFFAIVLARIILLAFQNKRALVPIFTTVFVIYLSLFALQRNREFKNDLSLFSEMVESYPDSVVGRNNLGLAYKNIGDVKEAEKQFVKAVESDSEYYLSYNNLGTLYGENREWSKALEYFKKSYELRSFPFTAYNIGICYKALGNLEKSSEYLDFAVTNDPELYIAQLSLADNFIRLRRFDDAKVILKNVLERSLNENDKKRASHYLTRAEEEESKASSR